MFGDALLASVSFKRLAEGVFGVFFRGDQRIQETSDAFHNDIIHAANMDVVFCQLQPDVRKFAGLSHDNSFSVILPITSSILYVATKRHNMSVLILLGLQFSQVNPVFVINFDLGSNWMEVLVEKW